VITATALFVDGPCRLQKRRITFDVQPPEFMTCGGARYTYSSHQGIEYLNYVVQGGVNDAGATGIVGQQDVFRAWRQLHTALNQTTRKHVLTVRGASARIRRAVR
jgi:hypothetical protein